MEWLKRLLGGSKPAGTSAAGDTTQAMQSPPKAPVHEMTIAASHKPQDGIAKMAGVIQATMQAQKQGAKGFLHVYQGNSKGTNVFLTTKPVRIGRKAGENELVLTDGGVSSKHCEVRFDAGAFKLIDVGSKNGTFVNDNKVTDKALQHGDLIAFGDTRIYVGII